ncbi:hypothetical protein GCM10010289_39600 [Streptomyces violascens]|nr:hypothetical protein GCM10010289_39600 [Streptomyces violascens]
MRGQIVQQFQYVETVRAGGQVDHGLGGEDVVSHGRHRKVRSVASRTRGSEQGPGPRENALRGAPK